jgi:hydrogenase nickel incorporation protein HypA/HybF
VAGLVVHEYGFVQNLLAAVDECVRSNGGARAVRVVVDVGGMDGHEERHLRDAFETFKVGSSAGAAELVVRHAPAEVRCLDCGTLTPPSADHTFLCSDCGGRRARPLLGREILLTSVEIEV